MNHNDKTDTSVYNFWSDTQILYEAMRLRLNNAEANASSIYYRIYLFINQGCLRRIHELMVRNLNGKCFTSK